MGTSFGYGLAGTLMVLTARLWWRYLPDFGPAYRINRIAGSVLISTLGLALLVAAIPNGLGSA